MVTSRTAIYSTVVTMSTQPQSLSSRLLSLSESNKSNAVLIGKLARISFEPGAPTEGEDTTADDRVELSSQIHDNLKQQEEELELLKAEVEDVTGTSSQSHRRRDNDKEAENRRLNIQVARLSEDLKQSRSLFRKAQLQAKKNAERAKQREKELLFAGIREGNNSPAPGRSKRGGEKLTAEELTANASTDVTAALRRTRQLMQTELSRSEFAQQTLEESTQALADLSERYTDLDTLLSSSRNLLSTLVSSQKSDTWYLETALYVLVATISWLVFRRFLYGPFWWFVWLPVKLAYRFLSVVSSAVGLTGGAAAVSSPSRPPLIVKPSAKGRAPQHPVVSGGQQHNIPVGRGGQGAGQGPDPSAAGSLSQSVGQMAEASRDATQGSSAEDPQAVGGDGKEEVKRGDGTVLEERKADKPANPKKRMWDEDAERRKAEEARRDKDEL